MSINAVFLTDKLTDLGPLAVAVGTRLAVAALAFVVAGALLRLARARGVISRTLAGLVKWLVALGLLFALRHSLPEPLADRLDSAFIVACLTVLWLGSRHGVDLAFDACLIGRAGGPTGGRVLKDLSKFLILMVLAGAGLKAIFDLQIGSLLTSSAILTAVVGLSMQDTIGSLVSGLLLQTEKPFDVGDWIKVGDLEGQVTELTWRYTRVVNLDLNAVLLPNNVVARERLVNYNRPGPASRRQVLVPAPPDAPPVKVKSAIFSALARCEGVLPEPAPMVRLAELRQDQCLYAVIFAVDRLDAAGPTADVVLSAVWYQFLERGIALPMPTLRLVRDTPAACPDPDDRLPALAAVELLSGMSEADLDMLARASVIRRFAAGQTIFVQNEPGSTMSIVLAGQVAILSDGRELARLGPGQIFGEMAMLTGVPRQATVRALTAARCLEVDREGFRMALARHPEIIERVRRICAERSVSHDNDVRAPANEGGSLFTLFKRLFP